MAEPARPRVFDRRFLAMLVVVMLVGTACYGFVARQQQVNSLIAISQGQGDQIRRLTEQNAEQNRISATRSRTASRERNLAYAQIQQLRRQVSASNRTALALVKILRANGIDVPNTITAPSTRSGSTHRPKAPHRPTSRGTPTPTEPSPSPSPSPDPAPPCVLPPPLPCALPLPTALPTLLPKD